MLVVLTLGAAGLVLISSSSAAALESDVAVEAPPAADPSVPSAASTEPDVDSGSQPSQELQSAAGSQATAGDTVDSIAVSEFAADSDTRNPVGGPDGFVSAGRTEVGGVEDGVARISQDAADGDPTTNIVTPSSTRDLIGVGDDIWFGTTTSGLGRITGSEPNAGLFGFGADPASETRDLVETGGRVWAGRAGEAYISSVAVDAPAGTATTNIPTLSSTHDLIVVGEDVWFGQTGADGLGRVGPTDAAAEFFPATSETRDLVEAGGFVWTGRAGEKVISKVAVDAVDGTSLTDIPTLASTLALIVGPNGNVWFGTTGGEIGRVRPEDDELTQWGSIVPGTFGNLTVGADNHIYFGVSDASLIGRIAADATAADEFDFFLTQGATFDPSQWARTILLGPDGNVWFGMDANAIGRITPDGETDFFATSAPTWKGGLAVVGPDIYFGEDASACPCWLGKITAVDTTVTATIDVTTNELPAGSLDYAISVSNLGPTDIGDVLLRHTVPAPVVLVGFDAASGWICHLPALGENGMVECSIPRLAASTTAVFNLWTRADEAPRQPTLVLSAIVTTAVDAIRAAATRVVSIPMPGADPVRARAEVVRTSQRSTSAPQAVAREALPRTGLGGLDLIGVGAALFLAGSTAGLSAALGTRRA